MNVRKRWLLGIATAAIIGGMTLAGACGSDSNNDNNSATNTPAATEMNETPMETSMSETPMETAMNGTPMADETMGANEVHVALKEYSIDNEMGGGDLPSPHAGTVAFEAHNDGTIEHTMLVIKTDLADGDLPVSGTTVDESQVDIVGRIDAIPSGQAKTLSLDLDAGHYVIICNIAGHYTQGMHTTLDVM
jgi:uncharacterized cupredoxin-like copper-binding protein